MNILRVANPLLKGIPEPRDFVAWGEWLYSDPRHQMPEVIPYEDLGIALPYIESVYAPREQDIDAAVALHEFLYHSLVKRNPLEEENKRAIYAVKASKGYSEDEEGRFGNYPWFPGTAPGAVFVGPSGCGKSTLLERILMRFQHVIHHSESKAAGWAKLDQLVYLRVHMPDDGTRSALFEAIALAMDAVLETDYFGTLKGMKTTSSQGIYILRRLQAHRCGMLIVEEAQVENVGVKTIGKVFVRFFLRVMNFGIPVLLVGTPLAFETLSADSQLYRRLSCGGEYDFAPELSPNTNHWKKSLMPVLGRWSVFAGPDHINHADFDRACWELTGGYPGYLRQLRHGILSECRKRRGSAPSLEDFLRAKRCPTFKGVSVHASAVARREVHAIKKMKDAPLQFFQRIWQEFDADQLAREIALKAAGSGASPSH